MDDSKGGGGEIRLGKWLVRGLWSCLWKLSRLEKGMTPRGEKAKEAPKFENFFPRVENVEKQVLPSAPEASRRRPCDVESALDILVALRCFIPS